MVAGIEGTLLAAPLNVEGATVTALATTTALVTTTARWAAVLMATTSCHMTR